MQSHILYHLYERAATPFVYICSLLATIPPKVAQSRFSPIAVDLEDLEAWSSSAFFGFPALAANPGWELKQDPGWGRRPWCTCLASRRLAAGRGEPLGGRAGEDARDAA